MGGGWDKKIEKNKYSTWLNKVSNGHAKSCRYCEVRHFQKRGHTGTSESDVLAKIDSRVVYFSKIEKISYNYVFILFFYVCLKLIVKILGGRRMLNMSKKSSEVRRYGQQIFSDTLPKIVSMVF